jgi:hypothetical protein
MRRQDNLRRRWREDTSKAVYALLMLGSVLHMLSKCLMYQFGKPRRVCLRQLGIFASACNMIMGMITSVTSKPLDNVVHGRSNSPWFKNRNAGMRHNAKHASIKPNRFHRMLVNKILNTIPTPIRTAIWPLNGNVPPGLNDFRGNNFKSIP